MMKALLVRIGVDQAFGGWNAPVDSEGNFIFVPIPEKMGTAFHGGLERHYDEVTPSLHRFCRDRGSDLCSDLKFPTGLGAYPMHLDPDFGELTYGDDGGRRGAGMAGMTEGDLLVFYAGLRPIHPCKHRLIYALVGLYVVCEVVSLQAIPRERWSENAHTRKVKWGVTDIVVRAKPNSSGCLERCLPIGEWRDGAYRVCEDVLAEWGGLSVKDGFIQRSAVPPSFLNPARFYDWFLHQRMPFVKGNGWA
jgi:hypothetical protein